MLVSGKNCVSCPQKGWLTQQPFNKIKLKTKKNPKTRGPIYPFLVFIFPHPLSLSLAPNFSVAPVSLTRAKKMLLTSITRIIFNYI